MYGPHEAEDAHAVDGLQVDKLVGCHGQRERREVDAASSHACRTRDKGYQACGTEPQGRLGY